MTFPFQCSHDAASPDGAASQLLRRLWAGQWELFIFFARPARSALLISGRRRTSISRSQITSTFATSPACDPMLYGCTIYTVPHRLFQLLSLCISPLGFSSPWAAASCLNPCSTVARHTQFLTLVLAFVPSHVGHHSPSHPTPSIHIMDRQSLL